MQQHRILEAVLLLNSLMFFQKEKHITWASLCHGSTAKNQFSYKQCWVRELACLYSTSYLSSQHLTGTQSYLLPSLSQASEIMVSAVFLSVMKAALQPCTPTCTLCLGEETTALKLSMTDPEASAGIMSHWHWRMTWAIPWTQTAAAAAPDPAASATMQRIPAQNQHLSCNEN